MINLCGVILTFTEVISQKFRSKIDSWFHFKYQLSCVVFFLKQNHLRLSESAITMYADVNIQLNRCPTFNKR